MSEREPFLLADDSTMDDLTKAHRQASPCCTEPGFFMTRSGYSCPRCQWEAIETATPEETK